MNKKLLFGLSTITLGSLTLPLLSSCASISQNVLNADDNGSTQGSVNAATTYIFFTSDDTSVKFVGETYVKATIGMPFATVSTPAAYKSDYVVSAWVNDEGDEIKNTDKVTADMVLHPKFDADVDLKSCVGVTAINESTITIVKHGANTPQIKYSTDGKYWTLYDWQKWEQGELVLSLEPGEVMYFKGYNKNGLSKSETEYVSFSIGGTVSLNGNVMTLLDDGQGTRDDIPCNYCFYKLFESCSGIVSISSNFMPAHKLKDYSYAYMFQDCKRLSDFPRTLLGKLDKLYIDEDYQATLCYCGMFLNCTGIRHIPIGLLPATQLSTYCYYAMFSGCNGLTELDGGILPATELGFQDGTYWRDYYGCYSNMFAGCKNLKTINETDANPLLPATKLARSCYYSMFSECTGLEDMSTLRLPATDFTFTSPTPDEEHATSAHDCYNQMFYGCAYEDEETPGVYYGLTKAPSLLATKLSPDCYSCMFYNCHALTDAPTFSTETTTLAARCYQYMFNNCTSLNSVPTIVTNNMGESSCSYMFQNCTSITTVPTTYLNGITLAAGCYEAMFQGCTSLTQAPNLPASTLQPYCYSSMFSNCISLTTAPRLEATGAAAYCYESMFYNCKALVGFRTGTSNRAIALTNSATNCCRMMFGECNQLNVVSVGTYGTPNLIIIYGDGDDFSYMFQHTVGWPDSGGPVMQAGQRYSISN